MEFTSNQDLGLQPQFFYRLGHCPQLGIEELTFQGVKVVDIIKNSQITKYAITNQSQENLPTFANFGSIVFCAKLLFQIQTSQSFSTNPIETLESCLKQLPVSKKLGIAITDKVLTNKLSPKSVINLAKNYGFKQINLISTEPNYGYFKSAKNWLIVEKINSNQIIGLQLIDRFNQDFWAKLDTNLPATDIKRGVINLKLARSLLNLTDKQKIYDPFAGQGRVLIAGLNLKSSFWASDIDSKVTADIQTNWDYAKSQFPNSTAKLTKCFSLPAQDMQFLEDDIAIVTEGYLGVNYGNNPSLEQIKNTYSNLEKIWTKVLEKARTFGYKEIIGCLPYYPQFKPNPLYPTFLSKICQNHDFEPHKWQSNTQDLKNPENVYFINYQRPNTFVGHSIFKAVLK
jgi:hypothetical protein